MAAVVVVAVVRVVRVGWLMKLRPRRRPRLVHWACKLPPLASSLRGGACVCRNNIIYCNTRVYSNLDTENARPPRRYRLMTIVLQYALSSPCPRRRHSLAYYPATSLVHYIIDRPAAAAAQTTDDCY